MSEGVIAALKEMDIMKPKESVKGRVVVKKSKVDDWMRTNRVGMRSPVDPNCFLDDLAAGERPNGEHDHT